MTDLGASILRVLDQTNAIDSLELSSILKEDHQKIIGCIKSLQSLGDVIESEQQNAKCWQLTEEGEEIASLGSHEALLYYAVPENGGILQTQLMKTIPNAKVGFSKAMSLGWIEIDKNQGDGPRVKRKVLKIEDSVQKDLLNVKNNGNNQISETQKQMLKKRKLLQELLVKSYLIRKGNEFSLSITKPETELTPEMIANNSWQEKTFKSYNFDSLGVPADRGHLHPLMKVRAQFRQIFLEMGFTEMPTNKFIESSFWNFDALFQPQQHPARDAHDTFFISDPKSTIDLPMDYLSRVKTVHETGGFGSHGYKCEWKLEEARKNLLRTHTTATSARMLYNLASNGFVPSKYFSIDRVFRNETLDATHLAEFHQIEGVIADYDLSLGDLIGVLHEFFSKLGIKQLRFKPAYNPYTEPSMEIFSYHSGLAKWVEIGNSGMFRPEMLLPMGLPPNIKVIAWGLSLERPTMIKYGIDNIRDLVGHKINLKMVHDNPICRLHKSTSSGVNFDLANLEKRQDVILDSLDQIKRRIQIERQKTVTRVKRRVKVISSKPIPSFLILQRQMKMNSIEPFVMTTDQKRPDNSFPTEDVSMSVDSTEIRGEVNVARYLARHLSPSYDELEDAVSATLIDQWLDLIHVSIVHGNNRERAAILKRLDSHLDEKDWLVGNKHSLADLVMWSALYQCMDCVDSAPIHVRAWLLRCSSLIFYEDARQIVAQLH